MSISRNRVERYYESLIHCYKKVNDLHEAIITDHERDDICENYNHYVRNLPIHLLEKTAGYLDGRHTEVNFISNNNLSRPVLINGFLSRTDFLPHFFDQDLGRVKVSIRPNILTKEEKLEVHYREIEEVVAFLDSIPEVKSFLKPFQSEIALNPLCLQDIFNKYLQALQKDTNETKSVDESSLNDEFNPELSEDNVDVIKEVAEVITKKILRLGHKERFAFEKKDELFHQISVNNIERFLTKEVVFYLDNIFLKENRLTINDIPYDMVEKSPEEFSDGLLSASSNVLVLELDDLGKPLPFAKTIKDLSEKSEEFKKGFFVVLNGFEKLLKEDLTEEFVSGLITKLQQTVGLPDLESKRISFASCYRISLAGIVHQPNKTKEDMAKFEDLIKVFHEKKQGLAKNIQPVNLDKLTSVYSDGGVSLIRNYLLDYISVDLLVEKCAAAKDRLFEVTGLMNELFKNEKTKVREYTSKGTAPVKKVLEPISNAYEKILSDLEFVREAPAKLAEKLAIKIKGKILKSLKVSDSAKWDAIVEENKAGGVATIIPALIEFVKEDFGNQFSNIASSEIKTLVKTKITSSFERKILYKKLRNFDDQLETKYSEFYEKHEDNFISKVNWVIEAKPIETKWDVQKLQVKPKVEGDWSEEISNQFLTDIQAFFSNRFAKAVDGLTDVLVKYLTTYLEQYQSNVDRLIEKIESDIMRNVDRVKEDENSLFKKVRKHLKLVGYVQNVTEIEKLKSELNVVLSRQ